eukprot:GHVS01108550.1.p1 GENE.GHVS01108550.1~~GHVS01108550.1.p1  ORF type:complete len:745 (+),score=205.10 GHVS01108550.1:161-2395(+)
MDSTTLLHSNNHSSLLILLITYFVFINIIICCYSSTILQTANLHKTKNIPVCHSPSSHPLFYPNTNLRHHNIDMHNSRISYHLSRVGGGVDIPCFQRTSSSQPYLSCSSSSTTRRSSKKRSMGLKDLVVADKLNLPVIDLSEGMSAAADGVDVHNQNISGCDNGNGGRRKQETKKKKEEGRGLPDKQNMVVVVLPEAFHWLQEELCYHKQEEHRHITKIKPYPSDHPSGAAAAALLYGTFDEATGTVTVKAVYRSNFHYLDNTGTPQMEATTASSAYDYEELLEGAGRASADAAAHALGLRVVGWIFICPENTKTKKPTNDDRANNNKLRRRRRSSESTSRPKLSAGSQWLFGGREIAVTCLLQQQVDQMYGQHSSSGGAASVVALAGVLQQRSANSDLSVEAYRVTDTCLKLSEDNHIMPPRLQFSCCQQQHGSGIMPATAASSTAVTTPSLGSKAAIPKSWPRRQKTQMGLSDLASEEDKEAAKTAAGSGDFNSLKLTTGVMLQTQQQHNDYSVGGTTGGKGGGGSSVMSATKSVQCQLVSRALPLIYSRPTSASASGSSSSGSSSSGSSGSGGSGGSGSGGSCSGGGGTTKNESLFPSPGFLMKVLESTNSWQISEESSGRQIAAKQRYEQQKMRLLRLMDKELRKCCCCVGEEMDHQAVGYKQPFELRLDCLKDFNLLMFILQFADTEEDKRAGLSYLIVRSRQTGEGIIDVVGDKSGGDEVLKYMLRRSIANVCKQIIS